MPRALTSEKARRAHVHKILLLAGINNDSGFLYSHLSVGCLHCRPLHRVRPSTIDIYK